MFIAMKAVHWNPAGYQKPAGYEASGGYPRQFGFGHEEWNNAPSMRFRHHGTAYRAFHTEPVSGAAAHSGDILLFMYASHDGRQDLVGIAGRVVDLTDKDVARARLGRSLPLAALWKDVWNVPLARERFDNDRQRLQQHWREHGPHMPRWTCPETHFLWLDQPLPMDARRLTGKRKFLSMFTRHTPINDDTAYRLLDSVPRSGRVAAWHSLRADLDAAGTSVDRDLQVLLQARLSQTTRKALVDARLGQGAFRSAVLDRWNDACAVTGCRINEVLRASHIKPWRGSTNEERLDAANGLALVATIDALFDRYLVAFEPDGAMVAAPALGQAERALLGIPRSLIRRPDARERAYLATHRRAFKERHAF